ncbi:MAG: hypothetical protein KAI47_09900 [Deltaproteobacteria bacterium]|nr:hypothetical protein [Deltaproteobacteria bacterium]
MTFWPPSIPVRARAFALPLTHLPRLSAAPVDSKALLATLETFMATLRPDLKGSLSQSVVSRKEAFHVNHDSLRAWADKNSGFISLIDVKHRATGRRTIFSAADAVNAILDKLGSLDVFDLQAGQTLDVVAVKAIRGEMVDAKTYKPMWVLSPGETLPAKRHTLSYRVIFGRRQGGIPVLRSSFIASITPQGRLVELSRLWHRVIVQADNTKLDAMPQGLDAWLRSQLITRGLSAVMAVELKGCGYLEPVMRDKTTSFAPTCLAIATDAENPQGRLFKLPLTTTAEEVTP